MRLVRESTAIVIIIALQGCGVGPTLNGTHSVSKRHSATLTATLDGQPVKLTSARISTFTLTDGAPSWTLGADGPDGWGRVEITCLASAFEAGTTQVLDDWPASEGAFVVVNTRGGLVAYSLDLSRSSMVAIESVADGRVTGRFSLRLIGHQPGAAESTPAELVCGHFELPLVHDDGTW